MLVAAALLLATMAMARPSPCMDNLDNDGDGYVDWPADPGCANKNDNDERNYAIECDDGVDNDGDGRADMGDSGCATPADNDETNCGDGTCEGGELCDACVADCSHCDSCTDTDGSNYWAQGHVYGYLNGSGYNSTDSCNDANTVTEYACDGAYRTSTLYGCGTDVSENICFNGSVYQNATDYGCANGACQADYSFTLVEECDYGCTNGVCDQAPDSCTSTDGMSPFVFGVQWGTYNGTPYNVSDVCLDWAVVHEYYCAGTQLYDFTFNCTMNATGCSNGACY